MQKNKKPGDKGPGNAENSLAVLVVEPRKAAYKKIIPEGLKSLQKEVGGSIEVIYPFEDQVGLVLNAEGKNKRLPLNRGLYDGEGNLCDIVAGTFLLVGLAEESFCPLPQELERKYMEKHKPPEMFAWVRRAAAAPVVTRDGEKHSRRTDSGKKKKDRGEDGR